MEASKWFVSRQFLVIESAEKLDGAGGERLDGFPLAIGECFRVHRIELHRAEDQVLRDGPTAGFVTDAFEAEHHMVRRALPAVVATSTIQSVPE